MLELEAAVTRILSSICALPVESVPITQSIGRFLAAQAVSSIDLPPFDNSAMDGYAVRSSDIASANRDRPVSLRLIAQVAAGQACPGQIEAGTCVRLFTGSPLPPGADAVVMQEDTASNPEQPEIIEIQEAAQPWENVRLRSEDIKAAETLVEDGERLTAQKIALLAATGWTNVPVRCRPRVALLATGNELRDDGQPLYPGQIYESNRATLAALAIDAGADPHLLPLVRDDLDATLQALRYALENCDVVITSGGVSVGEFDFVKAAIQKLGGTLDFWRVAIKPGKPFVYGACQNKPVFGLPGNPVSAFVTFLTLVRPALLRLQGATDTSLPSYGAALAETVINKGDRRHFMRVMLDREGLVRTAGTQASHRLKSLGIANGLLDVPPMTTWPAGWKVIVQRWN